MIQLTRLNSKALIVNSDLIKFVEHSPDTLVTLVTGEKIVVLEKPARSLRESWRFDVLCSKVSLSHGIRRRFTP